MDQPIERQAPRTWGTALSSPAALPTPRARSTILSGPCACDIRQMLRRLVRRIGGVCCLLPAQQRVRVETHKDDAGHEGDDHELGRAQSKDPVQRTACVSGVGGGKGGQACGHWVLTTEDTFRVPDEPATTHAFHVPWVARLAGRCCGRETRGSASRRRSSCSCWGCCCHMRCCCCRGC